MKRELIKKSTLSAGGEFPENGDFGGATGEKNTHALLEVLLAMNVTLLGQL